MKKRNSDLFEKLSEEDYQAATPVSSEALREAARRGEREAAQWEEEYFGREFPESSLAMRFLG